MKGTTAPLLDSWAFTLGLCLIAGCAGSDATSVALSLADTTGDDAGDGLASSHPIAFTSNRSSAERADLCLMALDGSVLRVTEGAATHHPRWSPSGASIAFREQVENTYAEVGLIHPDGTGRVLLTSGEQGIFGDYPVNWAPDGARIAFASRREADSTRIWAVPRTGGPGELLFRGDGSDRRELAWSPDGRRVAYADYDRSASVHVDGIAKDIWVADAADPAGAINLTQGQVHAPAYVRWSPDSRRVAFQAFARAADGSLEGIEPHEQEGPYVPPDYETFVLDVDAAILERVTNDDAVELGLAWSPDGTSLIVSSELDGDFDLWLISLADPSNARNLIDDGDDPYDDEEPDWFPGGR